MAIDATYRALLFEDFLKKQLTGGTIVNAATAKETIDNLIATKNLETPQFSASLYKITRLDPSSASKFVETFTVVQQDLRALYKEMLRLGQVSNEAFERWKLESVSIEKQLIDLEERIENLLLLTQDTEGYHSILVDNFTDATLTDLSLTTAELDLQSETVEMGTSSTGSTRIFLNDLEVGRDVSFKVRTSVGFIGRTDAVKSTLTNPFSQEAKSWWTSITMRNSGPVTCELTVRLADTAIPVSKIYLALHTSAESSPISITPLLSEDNVTFNQISSNTFTQEVRTNAIFQFTETNAKYVKFLLTKDGPDPSGGEDLFSYQFGFKEISFFAEGFATDTVQQFISEPLWVAASDGTPEEFEKLTLETCERIEANTSINYFITTSNVSTVPISSNTLWVPISPINRAIPLYPQILNVGDITETTIGDTETVSVSYLGTADTDFINPAASFQLLSRDATLGTVVDTTKTATIPRYSFVNSQDRILNYQIKDTDYLGTDTGLTINELTMILFRNVGEQGLDKNDISSKVRGIQRGWRFEDPYYSCVIEVQNPSGTTLDVGDRPIIIDDIKYTNKINETILTGKTASNTGIHTVKVHKSNWRPVAALSTTKDLIELKAKDTLYPYNHKYLIEGYDYPSDYNANDEQIYRGVDLFAETILTKVSIFDLLNNVAPNNYNVYALDRDTASSHGEANSPTRVFVLKINDANPDFQNERFVIRFTLIDQLQKYLRLRADFETTDEAISPTLHSYKIKLG